MDLSIKRLIDFLVAFLAIIALSPLVAILSALIYFQDFRAPWYCSRRVGRNGVPFTIYKLRTMVVKADSNGVTSTATDDPRITRLGSVLRRYKLDELPQLINVLIGDMSFVGPRPNVPSEVALYTLDEMDLLKVRPGITDFASIVFADEGQIISGHQDANLAYNQLIRPGKSRLGLFYIKSRSSIVDLCLIFMTAASIFRRKHVLNALASMLDELGAPADLVTLATRNTPLSPGLPPGQEVHDFKQYSRKHNSR